MSYGRYLESGFTPKLSDPSPNALIPLSTLPAASLCCGGEAVPWQTDSVSHSQDIPKTVEL